jgi:hypothetical protein
MQTPAGRTLAKWIVLASMVLVAACSSLRLAYNNGDTLLYWWLDAYVDFDGEQRAEVKHDIGDLFRWHRKTQLQDYIQFLQRAQNQLKGEVTQAQLKADYDDIRSRTQALLLKAAPDIADLALTLKPDQLEQMEKKFAKNNAKFRRENMRGDREEQNRYRYKKSMEQFELWFGNFTTEQEMAIRQASDARPLNNEIWLDERVRRQNNILAAVRKVQSEKLGKEATQALIQGLIKDGFQRLETSERKAFFDSYEEANVQFVLTVINLTTPQQKAHAQRRMQGWIDDFRTLAADQK